MIRLPAETRHSKATVTPPQGGVMGRFSTFVETRSFAFFAPVVFSLVFAFTAPHLVPCFAPVSAESDQMPATAPLEAGDVASRSEALATFEPRPVVATPRELQPHAAELPSAPRVAELSPPPEPRSEAEEPPPPPPAPTMSGPAAPPPAEPESDQTPPAPTATAEDVGPAPTASSDEP